MAGEERERCQHERLDMDGTCFKCGWSVITRDAAQPTPVAQGTEQGGAATEKAIHCHYCSRSDLYEPAAPVLFHAQKSSVKIQDFRCEASTSLLPSAPLRIRTEEEERKEFEAWANDKPFIKNWFPRPFIRFKDGRYFFLFLECAWQAWLAARRGRERR